VTQGRGGYLGSGLDPFGRSYLMSAHGRPVIKWKLADLRGHPRQQELFGDLADGPLDALAADMDANGQRDTIEILPSSTSNSGFWMRSLFTVTPDNLSGTKREPERHVWLRNGT
jgi:hypothetical protein